MKKFLVVLFILGLLGGGGYYAYQRFFAMTPARACRKVVKLCGESCERQWAAMQQQMPRWAAEKMPKPCDVKDQLRDCDATMVRVEQVVGKESVRAALGCIAKAKSCAEAAGCVQGALMGQTFEFLKGMRRALEGK